MAARRTAIYPAHAAVVYPALGLAGEAGEVSNTIKKVIRDGTLMPTEKLVAELGDVLWYVAVLADDLGVNRARCRRVIDAEGNCPPTDVFIVLRSGEEGDEILSHIQEEMPGVVVKPWAFELDGPQERIRRGSSHAALVAFMRNRLPGETAMSLIRKELGLGKSALKDLMIALRNEGHSLTKALAEIGVRYVSSGRGSRSFLLKS